MVSTFLFITELCSVVWIYQNWVVRFPVHGHMGKFEFFPDEQSYYVYSYMGLFGTLCFNFSWVNI